ncbi:MAG: delta-9 desaturase-like 1 protein [Candidatus Saccharibacteria bacterium]|nr:delta-9 desaturase-like 1 protein [Candidatus Saccharibacteria bacterium]
MAAKRLPPEATGAFDTKGAVVPWTTFGIIIFHIMAVAVVIYEIPRLPEILSAKLIIVTVLSILLPIGGITWTFHRGVAHVAFKWADNKRATVMRAIGLAFGTMAFQKGPINWAYMHIVHHKFVDQVKRFFDNVGRLVKTTSLDPHSMLRYAKWSKKHQEYRPTLRGFMYAHVFCYFFRFIAPPKNGADYVEEEEKAFREAPPGEEWEARLKVRKTHWVGDLEDDRMLRFFERFYFGFVGLRILIVTLICGWDGFLIAGILGVVVIWNITFCINSVAHMWGDALESIGEKVNMKLITGRSKNVFGFIFAFIGEHRHFNHHLLASCAAHGWTWKEVDLTKYWIWLMEKLGIHTNVKWMRDKRKKFLADEAEYQRLKKLENHDDMSMAA